MVNVIIKLIALKAFILFLWRGDGCTNKCERPQIYKQCTFSVSNTLIMHWNDRGLPYFINHVIELERPHYNIQHTNTPPYSHIYFLLLLIICYRREPTSNYIILLKKCIAIKKKLLYCATRNSKLIAYCIWKIKLRKDMWNRY